MRFTRSNESKLFILNYIKYEHQKTHQVGAFFFCKVKMPDYEFTVRLIHPKIPQFVPAVFENHIHILFLFLFLFHTLHEGGSMTKK